MIEEIVGYHSTWQTGLRRGYRRQLQKNAARYGDDVTENLNALVASQRLTIVGIFQESYRQGFERSRRRRRDAAAASLKQHADERPSLAMMNPESTSVSPLEARENEKALQKAIPVAELRSKKNETTWRPNDRARLSVASEDFGEMAKLIESTLFSRTQYFNRMWTLQETCVAKQVMLAHGRSFVHLADLFKVVEYLDHTLGTESELVNKAIRLQWINAEYRTLRRLTLRVLLYETRDRRCHDPRDRIYALLGLMLEQPTVLVQPDYQQPVARVHANATRFMIATGRSLDIICGHEGQESLPCHPSWTSDYARFAVDDATPLIDLSGRNTVYRASLSEPPGRITDPTSLPRDWQVLDVTSIYLGTVTRLSRRNSADEDVSQKAQDWKATLQQHF